MLLLPVLHMHPDAGHAYTPPAATPTCIAFPDDDGERSRPDMSRPGVAAAITISRRRCSLPAACWPASAICVKSNRQQRDGIAESNRLPSLTRALRCESAAIS
uniref:Uncharacterized protein n=1 Tax=Oryza sativa subsp. japonica TaxID=39947 RepID=Q8H388_ORYSJ|nr:hypothetical protein [Oryza sativa Japonica Group]